MQTSSEKHYPTAHPHDVTTQIPSSSPYNDLMGQTFVAPSRKRLFDGISIAQVIAASAAAATSMLLASKIGIAGSVIGAAVSSMVTVICSQLYRNALDASAEKLRLKQMSPDISSYPEYPTTGSPTRMYDAQAPALDEGVTLRPGARIAPTKLRARAAAERSANARKVAYASVGIALLAVALCAGAILLSTAGEGLGAKAPSIFGPAQPVASDTTVEADPSPEAPVTTPETTPNSTTDTNSNAPTDGSTAGNGSSSDGTTTPDAETGSGATTPDAEDGTTSTTPPASDSGSGATDGAMIESGTQSSTETGAKASA